MKKFLFVFAILCFIMSCKKDGKKTASSKVPTKKENLKTNTAKEEMEEDDTLVVPDEIANYLKKEMPGYEIIPREKWLSEEYLDGLSKYARPMYKEDILVEGDFNGDGEDDFATFLADKKGKVSLYAFHKTENGYKKYLLQKEGNSSFLGAGLETEDPGFIFGGNKEVGLEYNGINYNVYEKSGSTFYYDAGRYRKVNTSD